MTTRVRFAPSPTGRLHLGNVRAALINWLFARATGGRFLLRLDDTDAERSTEEFAASIKGDLLWLGLEWDEFARQSDRFDSYYAAIERLKEIGRLYPCYETAEELEQKRFRQVAGGGPQAYDRASLRLSETQKRSFEAEGRKPHWRLLLDHREIAWTDVIRGPVSFDGAKLSDPVLLRADATPTYTLATVVDDIDLGVTHIIRAEDHVANTAVQLQLFDALGRNTAALTFAHFTLLTDAGGHNLSKRLGSLSVAALRDQGIEAMAIDSLLARLGTSLPVEPVPTLGELVATFDLASFSRAAPKLDLEELRRLNARLIHGLSFAAVADRLRRSGLDDVDERLWNAARSNLATVAEIGLWRDICRGQIAPKIDDREFAATAARLLPPEPWDEATWQNWTRTVAGATGRKGRELFRPLRLALTQREDGPELKILLPLIGRARAFARLSGETA
ncbi:MAG: glutamate--tRNA ligase [Alphaproteobacteria bacterium]|nr:glutamate--tRNA ligase [Alphaproteobacteria bacterium]